MTSVHEISEFVRRIRIWYFWRPREHSLYSSGAPTSKTPEKLEIHGSKINDQRGSTGRPNAFWSSDSSKASQMAFFIYWGHYHTSTLEATFFALKIQKYHKKFDFWLKWPKTRFWLKINNFEAKMKGEESILWRIVLKRSNAQNNSKFQNPMSKVRSGDQWSHIQLVLELQNILENDEFLWKFACAPLGWCSKMCSTGRQKVYFRKLWLFLQISSLEVIGIRCISATVQPHLWKVQIQLIFTQNFELLW